MSSKTKRMRKHVSLDAKKARSGYLFVAPFLFGVIMIYLPILLDSIWLSFSMMVPGAAGELPTLVPQGFKYYNEALFVDASFTTKLWDSLQQLIFQVPAIIIFALFIAVILNQKMLGRAVFPRDLLHPCHHCHGLDGFHQRIGRLHRYR